MTFESDLFNLLTGVTPRVFPDFAPVKTQRPYVTYQQVGGAVINPLDGSVPTRRHSEMQINVWSDSRLQALLISRQIEDAMRGATAFTARPISAAVADYDADIPVYGCRQDFSCWHVT